MKQAYIKQQIILFLLLTLFVQKSVAQNDTVFIAYSDELPIFDKLFESSTPIVCTLKTDLKKFQKEKYEEKYQKAEFIYFDGTSTVSKKIRIKSRGVVRKKICAVPPIRLKFQKKQRGDESIAIQARVKMVTHCNYNQEYINYLMKEYLTYKTYSLLTPYSFKVRLIQITYIDTGRKNKAYSTWGFLIEPIELLAERMESIPIKMDQLGIHYTDSSTTDLLTMWQYMIGNTDWSVVGRHNVKLVKSIDFNQPAPIPIPYDFDYAGLVDSYYAVPGDGLGIDNVRERLFLGPCRDLNDYQTAASTILNKKNEIIELINNFEYLKEREKREMISYLDSFFQSIEKPAFIKYHIDTDCRTPSSIDE